MTNENKTKKELYPKNIDKIITDSIKTIDLNELEDWLKKKKMKFKINGSEKFIMPTVEDFKSMIKSTIMRYYVEHKDWDNWVGRSMRISHSIDKRLTFNDYGVGDGIYLNGGFSVKPSRDKKIFYLDFVFSLGHESYRELYNSKEGPEPSGRESFIQYFFDIF